MRIMFFVFLLFVMSCDSSEEPNQIQNVVNNPEVITVTYESAKKDLIEVSKVMGQADFLICDNMLAAFEFMLKDGQSFHWKSVDDTMATQVTDETRDAYYIWRKEALKKSKN